MNEVGRPDSLVRGLTVFGAYLLGVMTMVAIGNGRDLTVPVVIIVFLLAMVAANYVNRAAHDDR